MRFLVGFYTEKLSDLETKLGDIKKQRIGKREAITQIRTFLEEFGYDSEADVSHETQAIEQEMSEFYSLQTSLRHGYMTNTHFVEDLRQSLRDLSNRLAQEAQTLTDLYSQIEEKKALKADLLSAKMKVARSGSANALLSGVAFDSCPACGTKVNNPNYSEEHSCYLCGRCPQQHEESSQMNEVLKKDLISRILEIDESISLHKKSIKGQTRRNEKLQREKTRLDRQLVQELSNYDSAFLAESREVDRQIATLEERIHGLQRMSSMITGLKRLEHELHELKVSEEELEEQIQRERASLTNADQNIRDIENAYLDALIGSRVPGVHRNDIVEINRRTWIPWILSEGDEALKWYFSNAGSGGKKTLLKVCYAIALHKVASDNNLPLPSFLIIDTPMKNIGEEVNSDIFNSFYNYLYGLAETSLSDTQIIIVDKEYFSPDAYEVDYYQRYMTPDEVEYPPLISYYRGA